MKKIFVDTNYFLRFLLKDIPKQSEEVRKIFEEAIKQKIILFTSVMVFFEIYWVVKSSYKQNKSECVNYLISFLNMNFVDIENRELLLESLQLFNKFNIELEDCYNLAFAKINKATEFITFDKKLAKLV